MKQNIRIYSFHLLLVICAYSCTHGLANKYSEKKCINFNFIKKVISRDEKYMFSECNSGNSSLCYDYAIFLYNKNNSSFTIDSAVYFKKACEDGLGQGCYAIGCMYLNGLGLAKSIDKGIKFLRAACQMNIEEACTVFK